MLAAAMGRRGLLLRRTVGSPTTTGLVAGENSTVGAWQAHVYVVDLGWLELMWWLEGFKRPCLELFFLSSGAEPCIVLLVCFFFLVLLNLFGAWPSCSSPRSCFPYVSL